MNSLGVFCLLVAGALAVPADIVDPAKLTAATEAKVRCILKADSSIAIQGIEKPVYLCSDSEIGDIVLVADSKEPSLEVEIAKEALSRTARRRGGYGGFGGGGGFANSQASAGSFGGGGGRPGFGGGGGGAFANSQASSGGFGFGG